MSVNSSGGIKQGEDVSIEFSSADASAGSGSITLKDSQYKTRVLGLNERLILDSMIVGAATGCVTVDVYADINGNNTVDAGELILSFESTGTFANTWETQGEGMNVPKGFTPKVKTQAAGQVKITGTGRIINASTPSGRMPWRENLGPN
jgi:hypothetical protein